jgi:hypothetical protein
VHECKGICMRMQRFIFKCVYMCACTCLCNEHCARCNHRFLPSITLQNPVPKVSSGYKPMKKSISKSILKSQDAEMPVPILEGRALDDLTKAGADDGAFSALLSSGKNVVDDPFYARMMRPKSADSVDALPTEPPEILLEDFVFDHLAESVLGVKRTASLDVEAGAAVKTQVPRSPRAVRNKINVTLSTIPCQAFSGLEKIYRL